VRGNFPWTFVTQSQWYILRTCIILVAMKGIVSYCARL